MENKTKSLSKNAFNYSIFIGLLLIVVSLLIYTFNLYDQSKLTSFISIAIIIVGIILGTINYRNNSLGGYITYGKTFTSGLLIGLYSSIIVAVFTFLFYQFFAPEAINHLIEISEQAIVDKMPDITEEQLKSAMAIQSKFMTPVAMALMSILTYTFWAAIFSLIIAAFVKKENKSL
ncbi:MAG: DUF4199 domain-containing protein [Bacteroidales bacterium]|nr:DUF4199 domain-containing protein [Bacteroidales bacterium]